MAANPRAEIFHLPELSDDAAWEKYCPVARLWFHTNMAAGQLWLFPPPKPLLERFGDDFFRTLPTGPGVYFMCGPAEGVLYVGKARNLRKRLSSYRVANPERLPRRIIRLLHRVTRIEYDLCPTEEAASYREELLICVLNPRFNGAGKVWERKLAQGTILR